MIQHIVGPPGTGKTEALMGKVESCLAQGIHPDRICYMSFTRAAVNEARYRAANKFGLSRDSLPLFGTMHSLSYRALGLTRDDVLSTKQWREFAAAHRLATSADRSFDDEEPMDANEAPGTQEGDCLRTWYDWARNMDLPIDVATRKYDPPLTADWSPNRATWFVREYEEYKRDQNLLDFGDMLTEIRRRLWRPAAEVLVLDEAQDLSPLQRTLFVLWSEHVPTVYIAYDDDQCIYGFHGAEPTWLLNYPGERLFLTQSHRVPQKPAQIAQRVIRQNRNRYPKEWVPRAETGEVRWDVPLDMLDRILADSNESWFLLARNNYLLRRYTELLQDAAIPYVNLRGYSPMGNVPAAIKTALRLASGMEVTLNELRMLAEQTPAKTCWARGAKARLKVLAHERPNDLTAIHALCQLGATSLLSNSLLNLDTCLDHVKKVDRTKGYYRAIVKARGIGAISERPQVTVGSIHSVKGGQADNVVLLPDMSRRTFNELLDFPENERRVWYVALTRCRKRLLVAEPSQRCFYDEW